MSEGVKIEVFTLGEIILKFALPKTFIDLSILNYSNLLKSL